jgi:hypothetical protein
VADTTQDNRKAALEPLPLEEVDGPLAAQVREDDLEPHAGLRYVARLFKMLAVLLILLLIGEVVVGLTQEGPDSLATLLIEATRIVVFAGFLWGAGDLALMLIESNHDLRATRILLGRVNNKLQRMGPDDAGAVRKPENFVERAPRP